jgi:hypothetical protein
MSNDHVICKAIANHEEEMSRVLEIKPSKKLCLAISGEVKASSMEEDSL